MIRGTVACALLLGSAGFAAAQDSAAFCAQQPHLIGCLAPAAAIARTNVLPLSANNATVGATVAQILGALQGSDLDRVGLTPTGGAIARSLADHAGDRLTIRDLATIPTGTADATAALQTAQNLVQNAGGGLLRVPAGAYTIASNVYTAGDSAWLFDRGVSLAGAGQIDAVTDGQALNSSALTLARLLSSTGNEFGLHVSQRLAPTAGSTAYEKANIYRRLVSNDPSSYDSSGNSLVNRDGVVVEAQGSIAAGNLTGRIWGINTGVGPDAGAEGYAVGGEFGVSSYSGSDAAHLGLPTSKIGVHVVAYGNSTATAGVVLSGNGTTFQDGFVAQVQAISAGGHALSVRPIGSTRAADLAWIDTLGAATFTGLSLTSCPTSSTGLPHGALWCSGTAVNRVP